MTLRERARDFLTGLIRSFRPSTVEQTPTDWRCERCRGELADGQRARQAAHDAEELLEMAWGCSDVRMG